MTWDRQREPIEPVQRDHFDRIIGAIDGLPGVRRSRPSTVTSVLPILGNSQTHVVQTYKGDDGFYVFVQTVDAEGKARIVLPPKVAAAIYRQRDALVTAGRKERSRDRWDRMSDSERQARTVHLRRRASKGA